MPKALAFIARTIGAAELLARDLPIREAWHRAGTTRRPRPLAGDG
jgi:hypothetical protein